MDLPNTWQVLRDFVILLAGITGVVQQTILSNAEHPMLLVLFAAMIGLPAMLRETRLDDPKPYVKPVSIIAQLEAVDLKAAERAIERKEWEYARADDLVTDWDQLAKDVEPDLRKLIESGR